MALTNRMGVSNSRRLVGFLVLVAGAYQFTGVKQAYLRQSRSSLGFLMKHWRNGRGKVITLGLLHGTLRVGCCWALMSVTVLAQCDEPEVDCGARRGVFREKLIPSRAITRKMAGLQVVRGAAMLIGLGA